MEEDVNNYFKKLFLLRPSQIYSFISHPDQIVEETHNQKQQLREIWAS